MATDRKQPPRKKQPSDDEDRAPRYTWKPGDFEEEPAEAEPEPK